MRELQPDQTAAVVFGPAGSIRGSFGGVSTPASLVALAQAKVQDRVPLGLIGGLCAGVELALRKHQTVIQDEQMAAALAAEKVVRAADVPAWPKQQPIEGFARRVVQSCMDKAVELSVSGSKTQWVDYAAATEKAPQDPNTQPSTNWGLKTSIQQKTEAKFTAKIRAEHVESRDQLYVFVVVTAEGSRHSDKEQTPEALGLLARYKQYIRGTSLRSIVRFISVGPTVTLPLVERLKDSLQTVEHWEPRRAFAAKDAAMLPSLTAEMCAALSDVGLQKTVSIAVGHADQQLGCGFVTCLTRAPKWELDLTISPGQSRTVLFQGSMPRTVRLGGYSYRVDRSDAAAPTDKRQRPQTPAEILPMAELHRRQLALAQSLVTSLKIAAASGRLIDEAVRRMRGLLCGIRQTMFEASSEMTVEDLKKLTPLARVAVVQERRRLLSDIEMVANEIDDTVRVGRARADCADDWTVDLEDVKFGAAALRRVAAVTDDFAAEFSVEAILEDLLSVHFGKDRSARAELTPLEALDAAAASFGIQPSELAAVRELPRAVDLFSAIGMQGIVIRAARLGVAAVNPWLVVVEEVYAKRDSSDIVFGALESGLQYSPTELQEGGSAAAADSSSSFDVLVVADPVDPWHTLRLIKSKLHQLYLSVIFTRTPSVPLPAQRLALLMVSFVRITEQLLRGKMAKKKQFRSDDAKTLVMHSLHCMFTIRQLTKTISFYAEVGAKLADSEIDPSSYMTESAEDSIASVVQVLCAPICAPDPVVSNALFAPTIAAGAQLSRVALAILGESVSRGCRILVKQQAAKDATTTNHAVAYRPLLRKALGISLKSCCNVAADDQPELLEHSHSAEFEEASGRQASNNFFHASLTNCTPWAVIGCLGYCQRVWEWHAAHPVAREIGLDEALARPELCEALAEALLTAFDDRKTGISTNTFVKAHLETETGKFPMLVQIGLFAQGLRYSNSKSRRDGGLLSLADPATALRALAEEERRKVYEDRMAAKRARIVEAIAETARNSRLGRSRIKAAAALEAHGAPHMPRLFTPAEVDQLNMARPPADQFEIMGSGLLRHHCCFIGCSHYLKSFATEKDKRLGTRHGMFAHFKCWTVPDRTRIAMPYSPIFPIENAEGMENCP